ncbi:MAG: metal ABC transporter permease, partial [Deltaproteobacteria bacterium]|nr:metal ABC transporter permease [Deltaproteobacteria bacterium]
MDSGVLAIMLPAFAECLVLVGIHSYLGLHVIKRKVIFVDLALAQIAALGATVGFLFGMSPTSPAAFLYSMAFTFVGAAVFAASRFRKDRVPQEAVIGLVYAIAASTAILVIDKSPHGAEHIKDLLTGTILWVRWPTVLTAAIAYSAVGIFHFVLRHQFIRITEDPEGAFEAGMWVRLWDFFFYLSFGFVISFSVRTAGVLLVFVFLVAPAISAVLLTDRWR